MPKGAVDLNSPRRCTAHTARTGEQCKRWAIKGGNVCRVHGGAAIQVQRKARERFNDLVDPMINIAYRMVEEAEEGKLTATERLGLMKFIADRTGFVPGKTVGVDVELKPWQVVIDGIIREVPAFAGELAAPIIDGEVVEDSDEYIEDADTSEVEDDWDDSEDVDEGQAWDSNVRPLFPGAAPMTSRRSPDPPSHLL